VGIVAEAIKRRSSEGKAFSIVAVAEGARAKEESPLNIEEGKEKKGGGKKQAEKSDTEAERIGYTLGLSRLLEKLTGLESRVTILGHLQRGGRPSAADRLLATQLGTECAVILAKQKYGVMVAIKGGSAKLVSLEDVAEKRKVVPLDHPWIESARKVGTCLGC